MEDVQWLGFQWDGLYYASDYFQQLYEWAIQLITAGKAYVCDLSADEIRGTFSAHKLMIVDNGFSDKKALGKACLKGGNHCWIGSVPVAVATGVIWSAPVLTASN